MNYISPHSTFYSSPDYLSRDYSPIDLTLMNQPFKAGDKVRPHHNFKDYYPGITEVEVTSCEKGFCQSGWMVKVKEFNNTSFGKQEFDSSWFFKINK